MPAGGASSVCLTRGTVCSTSGLQDLHRTPADQVQTCYSMTSYINKHCCHHRASAVSCDAAAFHMYPGRDTAVSVMVHTRNVRVLMFPTDSSATPLLVLLAAAATAIGLQVPATDTLDSAAPSDVRTTLADAVQLRLLLLKVDETVRELTAMLCRGAAGGAGLGEGLLC